MSLIRIPGVMQVAIHCGNIGGGERFMLGATFLRALTATLTHAPRNCRIKQVMSLHESTYVVSHTFAGTLTQNRMHVQNVAVYDLELNPTELRDRIVHRRTAMETSHDQHKASSNAPFTDAARENLAQYGAVAGICNAATFAAEEKEKPLANREIIGDATGEFLVDSFKTDLTLVVIDSAILRYAESIAPVEESLKVWQEVFKVNFNSKVILALFQCRDEPLTFALSYTDQVHA